MTLVLVVLFGLMLLGIPVAFAILSAGMAYLATTGGSMLVVAQRLIYGLNSFTLLAVPLFILVGNLMDFGGISKRLTDWAKRTWNCNRIQLCDLCSADGLWSGDGSSDWFNYASFHAEGRLFQRNERGVSCIGRCIGTNHSSEYSHDYLWSYNESFNSGNVYGRGCPGTCYRTGVIVSQCRIRIQESGGSETCEDDEV